MEISGLCECGCMADECRWGITLGHKERVGYQRAWSLAALIWLSEERAMWAQMPWVSDRSLCLMKRVWDDQRAANGTCSTDEWYKVGAFVLVGGLMKAQHWISLRELIERKSHTSQRRIVFLSFSLSVTILKFILISADWKFGFIIHLFTLNYINH